MQIEIDTSDIGLTASESSVSLVLHFGWHQALAIGFLLVILNREAVTVVDRSSNDA